MHMNSLIRQTDDNEVMQVGIRMFERVKDIAREGRQMDRALMLMTMEHLIALNTLNLAIRERYSYCYRDEKHFERESKKTEAGLRKLLKAQKSSGVVERVMVMIDALLSVMQDIKEGGTDGLDESRRRAEESGSESLTTFANREGVGVKCSKGSKN